MRFKVLLIIAILFFAGSITVNESTVADPVTRDSGDDMFVGLNIPEETFINRTKIQFFMETSIPFENRTDYIFEYEISTDGEMTLIGNWENAEEIIEINGSIAISIEPLFKSGKGNFVLFRGRNSTGSFVESEVYNIWCDAMDPGFRLNSHSEDEYQMNPEQEIIVQIEDEDSGVDGSSIEYRYTTSGLENMTEWM